MGSFGETSYPVVAMKLLFFVFVLASAAALETYTETRDITDSAGNTFSCLYTIVYDTSRKVVYRRQSTVHCDPNTNGKQTTETIIIAEAGMSVDVTYQPRTDKHMPKKTAVSDYVAPTTTAAPTTAAPTTTGASSGESMGTMMEGVMDCTCMPNMTAMHEDMQMMESMMSASGCAIRYVKKVENGQVRVRPMPVVKDRLVGILLISLLRSQIQAAITSTISSLLSSALGRSIPANKVAKVALRQGLFGDLASNGGLLANGGLLGLTNNAAEQPANIMEDMAMNMIQQQIEQMISSGELENMLMEFLSSGALEQMMMEFMADPATEQMINEMMTEIMRPPTEEETAMMMSLVEEMMQMPSEEQMAEMEQGWMEMMSSMGMDPAQMEQAWAEWEAQMEAEWNANGGLMGMLGMTGEEMQMKSHCKCTSSDVAYGEMAMPTMPWPPARSNN